MSALLNRDDVNRVSRETVPRLLGRAVLADALRVLGREAMQNRQWNEVLDWLLDEKADGPFSFENCCDAAELASGQVRGRVLAQIVFGDRSYLMGLRERDAGDRYLIRPYLWGGPDED